jgi:hypothetical protein
MTMNKYFATLSRICNMSNTIAQDLATETSVELANHSEFKGSASNAAEFVFFKAVREDRILMPPKDSVTEIIQSLTSLAIRK